MDLPPVSNEECNGTYAEIHQDSIPKGIVKDMMLCAGGVKRKDTCQVYL